MFFSRDQIVLRIPVDSTAPDIRYLAEQLLVELRRCRASGVVIDLSAVEVLGTAGFESLVDLVRGIAVSGSRAVVVGFQPGVAAALVDLDLDLRVLDTASSVEAGGSWLAALKEDRGRR